MRILSILAQKPSSTGSGVYLMELVRQFSLQGQEQAVIAGVYEEDPSPFPKEVRYRPVTFKTTGLPFPIFGMSDEMPYESSRYRDMTPSNRRQFADAFLQALDEVVASFSPDLILCHHLYLLTALVREHLPRHRIYGFCHNTDLRQMVKTDLERDFIRDQIRRLDRIFVPQLSQQEEVRRIFGVEEEKIRQIGIGYNQERIRILLCGEETDLCGKDFRKKRSLQPAACTDAFGGKRRTIHADARGRRRGPGGIREDQEDGKGSALSGDFYGTSVAGGACRQIPGK